MGNIKLNSVYVIILNYQSFQDTINYVDNLQNQDEIDLHIVIVDNCSPNNSFGILNNHFSNCDYVEVIKSERNGGYAYGNNFGLRYIENRNIDYIIISNNDIEISDTMLVSKMIKHYEYLDSPAFVSPVMHINNHPSPYPAWKLPTLRDDLIGSLRITNLFFKKLITYNIPKESQYFEVDCLPGSFFMAKKNVFFEVGLLDEKTFLYMEEAILAFKVKKSEFKNYLLTDLQYNHLTAQTISSELSNIKMRKHLIDSRIYFHKEYLKTPILGLYLLKFLFLIWKIETYILNKLKK
jgi:GT2 family glycosyltransferase